MVRWLQGNDVLVSGHQLLDFVLILVISLGKCTSCPLSCNPSTAHQVPSLPPASPSHPDDLQLNFIVLLRATSQLCLGCVHCCQQSKLVVKIAIGHVEFQPGLLTSSLSARPPYHWSLPTSETACHRGGRHLEHQSHNEWMGSDWLVVICCKSFSEFD